jgi:hypothetical protein
MAKVPAWFTKKLERGRSIWPYGMFYFVACSARPASEIPLLVRPITALPLF